MASKWYYKILGDIVGPVSSKDLRQKVSKGEITPDSEVRKGDDGEWIFAVKVYGLFKTHGGSGEHVEY